nr:hypothetical protein CFP56_66933 [Quercus suber]
MENNNHLPDDHTGISPVPEAKDDAEPKLDSAAEEIKNEESEPHFDLEKASEDIDKFLSSLTSDDVSVEVPELVEKYLDLVEQKVSSEGRAKWRQVPDEDSAFLESLDRVSKLTKSLRELKPEEEKSESRGSLINRIGGIQYRKNNYSIFYFFFNFWVSDVRERTMGY